MSQQSIEAQRLIQEADGLWTPKLQAAYDDLRRAAPKEEDVLWIGMNETMHMMFLDVQYGVTSTRRSSS